MKVNSGVYSGVNEAFKEGIKGNLIENLWSVCGLIITCWTNVLSKPAVKTLKQCHGCYCDVFIVNFN